MGVPVPVSVVEQETLKCDEWIAVGPRPCLHDGQAAVAWGTQTLTNPSPSPAQKRSSCRQFDYALPEPPQHTPARATSSAGCRLGEDAKMCVASSNYPFGHLQRSSVGPGRTPTRTR